MCIFRVDYCTRCKAFGRKMLVDCGGPKDAGFCLTTQTGPGVGSGKWLIMHEIVYDLGICADCSRR